MNKKQKKYKLDQAIKFAEAMKLTEERKLAKYKKPSYDYILDWEEARKNE